MLDRINLENLRGWTNRNLIKFKGEMQIPALQTE